MQATPSNSAYFFARGLVARDNYVYQNGRVGMSWSGSGDGKTIGSGTVLLNNHVEVAKVRVGYLSEALLALA